MGVGSAAARAAKLLSFREFQTLYLWLDESYHRTVKFGVLSVVRRKDNTVESITIVLEDNSRLILYTNDSGEVVRRENVAKG